jgi:hypothetical protein
VIVPENAPPGPLVVEDVFHLPEGKVVLRTPAILSPESVEDLGDWLELILRSVQRSANGALPDRLEVR